MEHASTFITNIAVANWYSEPDDNASVVTQSLLGENGLILDENAKWYRVKGWDDYEGWVSKSQVVTAHRRFAFNAFVTDFDGTIIQPKTEIQLRRVTFGNRLKVLEFGSPNVVELPDGTQGYFDGHLARKDLTPTREHLVDTARSFLGVPYIWGGRSPWGFDCSGLVQAIFFRCGIRLPRDAGLQAEHLATETVSPEEAQPGDLFFFSTHEKVTHVAISIGGRDFIHAQGWVKQQTLNPKGANVNKGLIEHFHSGCSIKTNLVPAQKAVSA